MIELSRGDILVIPLASEILQEVAESIKLQLESRGASSVMIIDARKAHIGIRNAVYETTGVEIQLLSHGQSARF